MTSFPTQNPTFTLLTIFIIIFHYYFSQMIIITNAQYSHSDSVSFIYSSTTTLNLQDLVFSGDATSSGDTIHLTSRGKDGNPLPHSAGHAIYSQAVHIWDAPTASLADFTTVFYFSAVNRSSSLLHGDGFTFFMAPPDSTTTPSNSTGGLLGLYIPETTMDDNNSSSSSTDNDDGDVGNNNSYSSSSSSRNSTNNDDDNKFSSSAFSKLEFVAVEFDSFANEWDPNPFFEYPHVGINVNSMRSVRTMGWGGNYFEEDGAIVKARVRYDSEERELMVMVSYPDSDNDDNVDCLTHIIDLRNVLPEWVVIGFSGSTGDLVEATDIFFWSFKSSLKINSTNSNMQENTLDNVVSI